VYPHCVTKAENDGTTLSPRQCRIARHGRSKDDVDEVIRWLTGYSQGELEAALEDGRDFDTFFARAPALNPARELITGSVCGV
jgi:hypothetical protein